MATRGVFRYVRPLSEIEPILKQVASETFPGLDFATATQDQRIAVFQQAVQAGLLIDEREVPVLSLREHTLSLAQGGVQMCAAPSRVNFQSTDFRQPIDIESEYRSESHLAYYAEVEQLACSLLGPGVVHAWCLSHIIRLSGGSEAVGEHAGPIRFVHNDYTEEYDDIVRKNYTTQQTIRARHLRKMLKRLKGIELTAEEIAKYRLVVLNTWRPITVDPLQRDPLAVCDNRSVSRKDLQRRRTDVGKKQDDPDDDFALEIYTSRYNPDHKWHYVPEFTNQEVLVFKTFDSAMDPFIPTMHSAFDLPNQDAAPCRESCEARVLCLMHDDTMPTSKL